MGRIYIQCFIIITLKTCTLIYIHKSKHTYLCMDYTYSYTVLCTYKIQWNLSWGAEESEKLCILARTEASSFPISCWSMGVGIRVKSSSPVPWPHPLLHWRKLTAAPDESSTLLEDSQFHKEENLCSVLKYDGAGKVLQLVHLWGTMWPDCKMGMTRTILDKNHS